TGLAAAVLAGTPHTRIEPPSEEDAYRAFFAACAARGEVTVGDVHVRHVDGQLIPVEISASVTWFSGARVVQSLVRDVRERRRTEAALRQSEARWRAISTLTSDWAYGYRRTPGGELILEWVTEAFTRITGFTLEEAQARGGLLRLVHPDDLAVVQQREESRLD